MSDAKQLTAEDVRALLRKHYDGRAYAMLEEVRNGTGYGRRERYADALVVSLWPSRGIWFAGIEIKVSRSDWLAELKNPAKSAEIQRWCDYWWIAAPEGLVRTGELPPTWGLLSCSSGGKISVEHAAPKLEASPPSAAFVAAIMRRAAEAQKEAVGVIREEARKEALSECDENAIKKLRDEAYQAQRRAAMLQQDNARLTEGYDRWQMLCTDLGSRAVSFYETSGDAVGRIKRRLEALRALEAAAAVDWRAQALRLRTAADAVEAIANAKAREQDGGLDQ